MDAEHVREISALRPARRSEKLIVREVGDELVAYALDTEQVTALDPASSAVFQASDGSATVTEIAERVGIDETAVAAQLDRLQRGGLIASGWLNRRTLIGASIAAPLLTVVAAQAAFAASATSVALNSISCTSPGSSIVLNFSITVTTTAIGTHGYQILKGATVVGTGSLSVPSSPFTTTLSATTTGTGNNSFTVRIYTSSATATGPFVTSNPMSKNLSGC